MKKLLYLLTLFIIYGCDMGTIYPSVNCPEKPQTTLNAKDVQEIELNEQTLKKSHQASASKSIGYKFAAKSGQQLSYSIDSNICIWVYSPNNQILKNSSLPQTGKYIIEIAVPQGSANFELEMYLSDLITYNPTPSVSPTSSPYTTST